jgi:hypothetical protein
MIKYWLLNNILVVILSFIILVLSFVLVFNNKTEVIVIAVDKFGARVMNDSKADKELREKETVQFISEFVTYYFNFDEYNFKNQISTGSGYLSLDLWSNSELEIFNKLSEEMISNPFSLNSKLIKLDHIEGTNIYQLTLKSNLSQKGIVHQKDQNISISIKNIERSKQNPWGAEIYELNRNI